MNASNLNYQSKPKTKTLLRRSADFCAIALIKNRAEICAPTLFATLMFACISIPAAHAGQLGRLFFTPEQRAQLDYTYARDAAAEGDSSAILTVNGIVQKSGGARTVWVNGVAQSVENGDRNTTAQAVSVPGKSRPVKLKVGDKILLDQPTQTDRSTSGE